MTHGKPAHPMGGTPLMGGSQHRDVLLLAVRTSLGLLRTYAFGTGVRLSALVSAPRPTVEAVP
jgi:hypothetical protein